MDEVPPKAWSAEGWMYATLPPQVDRLFPRLELGPYLCAWTVVAAL